MKKNLGGILREARLKKGLKQVEVAQKANISQPYYNLIENDKARPPSFYVIEKLAKILDCDPKPLIKIVEFKQLEYRRKDTEEKSRSLGFKTSDEPIRRIPILNEIPAGHPKDYTDLDYPPGVAQEYYEFKSNDDNAFFLRVNGDCMSPEIKKGDLLLIAPSEKVENGDIAAVVNHKGEKEVRRVTIREDQVILTAENPVYPVIVWMSKIDKPKIIGRVKEIIRRR